MKQIYYRIIDIYNLVLSLKPKRWTRSMQSLSQNSLLAIKSSGNYFVYEQKKIVENQTIQG